MNNKPFVADLHVHSKYSRATSRHLDLEHLAFWAMKKGITVVGTGDFTHPAWMAEIKEKLVPAEPGLFRLRGDLERSVGRGLQVADIEPVRFTLQVEISTIYKKSDRTRKVHHLIYAPGIAQAERLVEQLSRIGNLAADGRPILGLDSRDLLEITLETGDDCYLVPAHIWTPWFSVLGAKSGFDSIAACYGDLAHHIFAAETGLSSDPPMNWRFSALDRYTLVSNSDAHSPAKLGREACLFDTVLDYVAIKEALETGEGYLGTVEFFPEEGKYHLDGHRACDVRLEPEETRRLDGRCPACGKPLTVGVLHRVYELADRPAEEPSPGATPFHSLIPLAEILAELQGVGPTSKTVQRTYERALASVGSELFLLKDAPPEDLRRVGLPLLEEAIRRMRAGEVIRDPGYDGEYGVIRLFSDDELRQGNAVGLLFDLPEQVEPAAVEEAYARYEAAPAVSEHEKQQETPAPIAQPALLPASDTSPILAGLDPDQRRAAEIIEGPLLIVAGPGTGKTRTLTHRIAYLVAEHGVSPETCLAITFTRRAAEEMCQRLVTLLPTQGRDVPVMTFHALGLTILQEYGHLLDLPEAIRVATEVEQVQVLAEELDITESAARTLLVQISRARRGARTLDPDLERSLSAYRDAMHGRGFVDFDDLIACSVDVLREHPDVAATLRARYRWVSIDEYQDVDEGQYQLVTLLVPADGNLCVIGDPDQAIYGFRGGDVRFFQRFQADYPQARMVQLMRNYRSSRAIVDAAVQAIAPATLVQDRTLEALRDGPRRITLRECPTDRAEAEFVVHTIERLIGGATFFSFDSGRVQTDEGRPLSFSDFAVLYRTNEQAGVLEEALARSGIPYQQRSHRPLVEHPMVQFLVEQMRSEPTATSIEERLSTATEMWRERHGDGVEGAVLLEALQPIARQAGSDLDAFCSELALGVDVDLWDPRAERVSLLTLHASKGLEFRVVFLVGCEDGLLPLRRETSDDANVDEERRLFFVGMTRAGEQLYLSHARRRRRYGKSISQESSPFLQDIQEALIERKRSERTSDDSSSSTGRQLTLF